MKATEEKNEPANLSGWLTMGFASRAGRAEPQTRSTRLEGVTTRERPMA